MISKKIFLYALIFSGTTLFAMQNIGLQLPVIPLIAAADTGDLAQVQILLDNGVDVDVRDAQGMTALMHAALHGHTHVVTTLLVHGAQINTNEIQQ